MNTGIQYMYLVYVFISAQTGCVMTDSMLTQVEGDSRMRSRKRETETDREGEIEKE